MKKIRKGIFETNSSSTHSIHIDQDTVLMDTSLVPDDNGVVKIDSDYFGWEWDKLTSAYDKASYCLSDQKNDENNLDMLKEVIMEQTGAHEVILNTEGDYVGIDHQSSGNTNSAFDNKDTLRNLLFNTGSIIFTGNDNSEPTLHFYCDSTNGKYKMTLIDESIYREMNIDSILDSDQELDDSNFEWVYNFNKEEESIQDSVSEFIEHLGGSDGPYIQHNLDFEEMVVTTYNYDYRNGERKDEKRYMILIKENIL